jgi:hypothetical protein
MNAIKNRSESSAEPDKGNKLFPIFLKLENLKVLIVGGGNVALEKLNAIIFNSPETEVTLVAPEILPGIERVAEQYQNVKLKKRVFFPGDIFSSDIVIAATADNELNKIIRDEARKREILVNVVDTPELCDFYLGSVVKKGDFKIAVSTNGKSPTFAKRMKEILDESLPEETHEVLENLAEIRSNLKGDLSHKVKELNKITAVLVEKEKKSTARKILIATLYSLAVIVLMIFGYLFFTYVPLTGIENLVSDIISKFDSNFLLYIAGGFTAQMIDGALGMAYGVSVTTFLLSLGIPAITPAVASASMHASEVFTTGSSSLVYMRYKNVNMKLFRKLLWPGALGAIAGALAISFVSKKYFAVVKPVIALYTLTLGLLIIIRTIRVSAHKTKKIKHIQPVALFGGFFDSVGGGGWGPIVTTSLIAGGRNLRYSIGSSHLAKFFVAIISTITFFSVIGISHWQIILGLVVGGMVAAPISIYFSNKIPVKGGLILVGSLVVIVSIRTIILALL